MKKAIIKKLTGIIPGRNIFQPFIGLISAQIPLLSRRQKIYSYQLPNR